MKLEFYNVNKYYGKNHALCDFTATLDLGIYALMGPNGSGKSTLMNILTDNIRADNGKILYDGENVMNMGVRVRTAGPCFLLRCRGSYSKTLPLQ